MANVHRLGDYHNLPQSNEQRVQWGPPADAMDKIPFYGLRQQGSGDPKQESFPKMLYLAFCPKLQLISFTSIIVTIITVLFIVVLCIGGVFTQGSFLQTQPETMKDFGAMNQQLLGDGQIYRLVTAIFLHWNFIHIFFNSVALLSCMSFMERSYGILATIGIFMIGGIGGNIFSACVSSWNTFGLAAGASTSIFAIIGSWISFIILNWKGLENVIGSQIRCMMCCMVGLNIMIVWAISGIGNYGATTEIKQINTDQLGHLGGFLTGILIGLWIPAPMEPSNYTKNCRITGIALTCTFFLLSFVLFYTTKVP